MAGSGATTRDAVAGWRSGGSQNNCPQLFCTLDGSAGQRRSAFSECSAIEIEEFVKPQHIPPCAIRPRPTLCRSSPGLATTKQLPKRISAPFGFTPMDARFDNLCGVAVSACSFQTRASSVRGRRGPMCLLLFLLGSFKTCSPLAQGQRGLQQCDVCVCPWLAFCIQPSPPVIWPRPTQCRSSPGLETTKQLQNEPRPPSASRRWTPGFRTCAVSLCPLVVFKPRLHRHRAEGGQCVCCFFACSFQTCSPLAQSQRGLWLAFYVQPSPPVIRPRPTLRRSSPGLETRKAPFTSCTRHAGCLQLPLTVTRQLALTIMRR